VSISTLIFHKETAVDIIRPRGGAPTNAHATPTYEKRSDVVRLVVALFRSVRPPEKIARTETKAEAGEAIRRWGEK
jgi:hypothetical protein